jgi:hypothetical protein
MLMAVGGVRGDGDAESAVLSRGRMWWNLAMVTGRGVILVARPLVPAGGRRCRLGGLLRTAWHSRS